MKVTLHMPTEFCHGNILWTLAYPPRNGRWPASHPVAPNQNVFGNRVGDIQLGDTDPLTTFRNRGYWASCFPEGDGITFSVTADDKGRDDVVRDIVECFGWEVV